jgi:hypothetical protein
MYYKNEKKYDIIFFLVFPLSIFSQQETLSGVYFKTVCINENKKHNEIFNFKSDTFEHYYWVDRIMYQGKGIYKIKNDSIYFKYMDLKDFDVYQVRLTIEKIRDIDDDTVSLKFNINTDNYYKNIHFDSIKYYDFSGNEKILKEENNLKKDTFKAIEKIFIVFDNGLRYQLDNRRYLSFNYNFKKNMLNYEFIFDDKKTKNLKNHVDSYKIKIIKKKKIVMKNKNNHCMYNINNKKGKNFKKFIKMKNSIEFYAQ